MATSYGTYSFHDMKFDIEKPLTLHDAEISTCRKCERNWTGGTLCYDCHPNFLTFIQPRKEYLEANAYTGKIPQELVERWKSIDPPLPMKHKFVLADVIKNLKT